MRVSLYQNIAFILTLVIVQELLLFVENEYQKESYFRRRQYCLIHTVVRFVEKHT